MAILNEANSAFSIIDDFVVSVGHAGKTLSKKDWGKYKSNGMLNKSSIMKASKDLVMSFPVICSDSIQPETAAIIVKAVEHNCVTTLRMLFSATYLRGDSGQEVLRKFHKNIDNDLSMDDYLTVMDNLASSGIIDNGVNVVAKGLKLKEGAVFSTPRGEKMTTAVFLREATQELQRPKTYLPDDNFSESSLSNSEVDSFGRVSLNEIKRNASNIYNPKNIVNKDGSIKSIPTINGFDQYGMPISGTRSTYGIGAKTPEEGWDNIKQAQEYDKDFIEVPKYDSNGNRVKGTEFLTKNQFDAEEKIRTRIINAKTQAERDKYQKELDAKRAEYQAKRDEIEDDFRKRREEREEERNRIMDQIDQRNAKLDLFSKQLLDTDVKKCNALVPSLIVVRYNVTDASRTNGTLVEDQFIAGVKANLYTSSTREIVDKVKAAFTNSGKLGWIKATTGEINFMKDFLLGIDKAKISAKNTKLSQTSTIWNHLQHRSTKSVLNRLRRGKANDAGAITTLCITNEEADYLNKEYGINLMEVKKAQKLMEYYNFMQIIIVDENFEVARFLMDGSKYWEDHAFSTLEREDKDNSYKKVVNLLGKVNRG